MKLRDFVGRCRCRTAPLAAVAAVVLATAAVTGCFDNLVSGNGILQIHVIGDLPSVPARYLIDGVGPGGASVSVVSAEATATVDLSAAGDWRFDAVAYSESGEMIGSGTTETSAVLGQRSSTDIIVQPVTSGQPLTVHLVWEGDTVLDVGVIGGAVEVSAGDVAQFAAGVSDPPQDLVVHWYIDGVYVDSGPQLTVDTADFTAGQYRIDVVVTADGGAAGGSASSTLEVL